jgi:hypothetical protein
MAGSRSRKKVEWLQFGSGKSYFHRVHRPLQCLIFIMPLLVFYQVGSFVYPMGSGTPAPGSPLVAFNLILDFFRLFGAVGNVLPLLGAVAILFCWHLARKDPWEFDLNLYGGMAAESAVWGIPFVVIGMAVLSHGHAMAAGGGPGGGMWYNVVQSVGAGVYEELLFRLIAINVLSMILMDAFELKPSLAIPAIILTSALLFSASHLFGEKFDAGVFAFRASMGIYLAGIYIYRGFGIAVGAHTTYDLFVTVLLPALRS